MNQITSGYSSASADIQNLIANDITLMDRYILFQTDENEWTALIQNVATKKTRQIRVYRSNTSGYSSVYSVDRSEVDTMTFDVSNEYYTYSNIGYGKSLNLPVYDGVTAWCLMICTCLLMFAVVFKGALFRCLRKRK